MTGQAYSASSEPNYRQWAVGGLFALGLLGSLWYACRAPAKESLPEEAALEESKPRPVQGLDRKDLVARLEATDRKLSQLHQALGGAGERIRQLNDQVARFRREAEGRGEHFPPPVTDVRHIGGYVTQRSSGDVWMVEGEWLNLGETVAAGYAELQLRINGKEAGEVLKVSTDPIPPGGRSPYWVTLPRVPGDDKISHHVDVRAVWRQL